MAATDQISHYWLWPELTCNFSFQVTMEMVEPRVAVLAFNSNDPIHEILQQSESASRTMANWQYHI